MQRLATPRSPIKPRKNIARSWVREKVEAEGVEDAEADPMRARLRSAGLDLGTQQGHADMEVGMDVDGGDGNCT